GPGGAAFVDPDNIVCQRRCASELLYPGGVLATVIEAVHHTLQGSFSQGRTESTREPGYDELFVQALGRKFVEEGDGLSVIRPRGRLQLRKGGLFLELFLDVRQVALEYLEKASLHRVKMGEPLT